jgi:Transposase DDE domain
MRGVVLSKFPIMMLFKPDKPPTLGPSEQISPPRSNSSPQAMRIRRETVEHPFGTIKARMGATHFLMKRLKNVKTEMALAVLAYNLTRVMNIIGIKPLIAAIRLFSRLISRTCAEMIIWIALTASLSPTCELHRNPRLRIRAAPLAWE